MLELATPKTLSQPLAEWAVKRIILDGQRFSFEGHEYLREIYDDPHRNIVLCKAAQIGGTTWAILRAMDACRKGLNAGYFFPTKTDVTDFSKARISPLFEENPFLVPFLSDSNTACLKRLNGAGHLYLRGLQSTASMKSIPLDIAILDELDEADPVSMSYVAQRLGHSIHKILIQLSNPSIPGYGIDAAYEASDQRDWMIRCPGCSKEVIPILEFPARRGEDVRLILPHESGGHYLACPRCSAELDPDKGQWVAAYPGRDSHGYRLSQLFSSRVDLGELLRDYRRTAYCDRFYNLRIGLAWADLEHKLTVGTVLGLCSETTLPRKEELGCIMGVDTGKELHVVILEETERYSGIFQLVHAGVCSTFGELDELVGRFEVKTCVIDGEPEMHATRDFKNRHSRCEIYMSFFNHHQRGAYKWNNDDGIVSSNRTEALDASRAAVREKKLVLPPPDELIRLFAKHMAANAKVLVQDEDTGAKSYKYVRTGEDHFSLAFTYAWMAATRKEPNMGLLDYYRMLHDERVKKKKAM